MRTSQVGTLARWTVVVAGMLLVAGCVAVPGPRPRSEPLPEPETFRSVVAVPTTDDGRLTTDDGRAPTRGVSTQRFVPLVAGPGGGYGKGGAVPHEYAGWGCADAQRLGVGWLYDWSALPPVCDDVVSVPMVWGRFDAATCPALGPGPFVLGFNEPDRKDQANLSPDEAARLWHRLTVECYPERVFATPATCATDGYLALDWLSDWITAYVRLYGETLPRAKYMAVHCFTWTGAESCKLRIKQAMVWARGHGLAGIIVSEWAVLPGVIGEAAALREAQALRSWLEAEPYVVGHAWTSTRIEGGEKWWFGKENNTSLIGFESGALTTFGEWYRGR